MKFIAVSFLLFISIIGLSQVKSVELFPDVVNSSADLISLRPSINDSQNRLCYLQHDKGKKIRRIMVSDKSGNGTWSQPYAALEFKKVEYSLSISMSAAGNQIYFDMRDDIWVIEYLGGTAWSKPQRIDTSVSQPGSMEILPSIS